MLDTDVLSLLVSGDARVTGYANVYLDRYLRLTISATTDFELLRGFEARPAPAKERGYRDLSRFIEVLPVDAEVFRVAAVEYGRLYRAGRLIPDADLLIAATALVHGLTLVTNNQDDFALIEGPRLDNWLV